MILYPSLPHKKIIWNSRNIMIDGKPPFYKCWFEINSTCVEDLLDDNGNFLPFNQFFDQFQFKTPFTLILNQTGLSKLNENQQ